jgi:uncharacterized protein
MLYRVSMAPSCWILTDGRTGTENNARGLAEALGLAYEVKPVSLRQPWKTLSPWLRLGLKYAFNGHSLTPPWPDVLITAGRTPAVGSLYIGQQSPGSVRVHITNPGVSPQLFDLVVAPAHDRLGGENVLNTVGALHRVTADKLAEAAKVWQPKFEHLPRPWHAVLLGGNTSDYQLTPELAAQFIQSIKAQGGSVLVTASRRTSESARAALAKTADYLWDGQGDNPYFGLLALADNLFVTADSISMLSEAASIGKPTYLLPLAGHAAKHERFHQAMFAGGFLTLFSGQLTAAKPQRLDDIGKAATRVRELLIARGKLSR